MEHDIASVAQTDSFCSNLQHYGFIHSTWIEQVSNIIFVCEDFFSLYIVYSFILLYYSTSSHTILTRLLALTPMIYKFLKIGIVVGPIPHIEIAIDDTPGNCIILSHATWMAFIEKRVDIQRTWYIMYLIESNNTGLIIELVKIYNVDNVKISLSEKCLYI